MENALFLDIVDNKKHSLYNKTLFPPTQTICCIESTTHTQRVKKKVADPWLGGTWFVSRSSVYPVFYCLRWRRKVGKIETERRRLIFVRETKGHIVGILILAWKLRGVQRKFLFPPSLVGWKSIRWRKIAFVILVLPFKSGRMEIAMLLDTWGFYVLEKSKVEFVCFRVERLKYIFGSKIAKWEIKT